MSQTLKATRGGNRAEYLGTFLLSAISQAIPVPRQEDFGVDYHGAVLHEADHVLRPGREFAVQIKSSRDGLTKVYGAPRGTGKPHRPHEIQWLLGIEPYVPSSVPLFLAVVDEAAVSLNLYAIEAMWHARWVYGQPTELRFITNEWPDMHIKRTPVEVPAGVSVDGDQQRSHVPIGYPIATIDRNTIVDRGAVAAVVSTLTEWIRIGSLNRIAALLGDRSTKHGGPLPPAR